MNQYWPYLQQPQQQEKEKKTPARITQLLQFGKFLNFLNTSLTTSEIIVSEEMFRRYWKRTGKGKSTGSGGYNERQRFMEAHRLIYCKK